MKGISSYTRFKIYWRWIWNKDTALPYVTLKTSSVLRSRSISLTITINWSDTRTSSREWLGSFRSGQDKTWRWELDGKWNIFILSLEGIFRSPIVSCKSAIYRARKEGVNGGCNMHIISWGDWRMCHWKEEQANSGVRFKFSKKLFKYNS